MLSGGTLDLDVKVAASRDAYESLVVEGIEQGIGQLSGIVQLSFPFFASNDSNERSPVHCCCSFLCCSFTLT